MTRLRNRLALKLHRSVTMKSHDELVAMSDDDRLAYLAAESERIITSAPPKYQLKLRALQAKCDGIRRRVKNPLVSARIMSDLMQRKFDELRARLND